MGKGLFYNSPFFLQYFIKKVIILLVFYGFFRHILIGISYFYIYEENIMKITMRDYTFNITGKIIVYFFAFEIIYLTYHILRLAIGETTDIFSGIWNCISAMSTAWILAGLASAWKHWKIKGLFIFIFLGSFVPVLVAKFPKFSHVVGIITMTTIQPNLLSFIIVNVVMGVIAWIYEGDVQARKNEGTLYDDIFE